MKMVLARARCEGGSRRVPRGSRRSLPKGCWRSISTMSCRRPAQFPVLKTIVQQQGVAAELLDGVAAALDAVLVHQHDHVLEIGGQHVGLVAGHLGVQQQGFAVGDDARRGGVVAEQDLFSSHWWNGPRLGAVAAGEDGHVAALVAQLAGELLDHRRLAGAAHGEIADGDDLHPEGRVAQNAEVVEEAADLDGDLEDLGAAVEQAPHECLARPAPLLDDHLQDEGLKVFCPSTKPLTHLGSVCQGPRVRASRRHEPLRPGMVGAGGALWVGFLAAIASQAGAFPPVLNALVACLALASFGRWQV